MAKNNRGSIQTAAAPATTPPETSPSEDRSGSMVLAIVLPKMTERPAQPVIHIQAQLTMRQAKALRDLRFALADQNFKRLPRTDGPPQPVESAAHAIMWLLEQVAEPSEILQLAEA